MADIRDEMVKHTAALERYARKLTRNKDIWRDVFQQTMLKTLLKQHLFQEGTNLLKWMICIMHNEYVNIVRKSVRHGVCFDIDDLSEVLSIRETQEDRTRLADLIDEITDAFKNMNQDQSALVLFYLDNPQATYDDGCAAFNVPIGTLRSRLSRGREKLRQAIT